MAVAKCVRCEATATVRIVDGEAVSTLGESFRESCRERKSQKTEIQLGDCSTMSEAIAVTSNRLKAGLGAN